MKKSKLLVLGLITLILAGGIVLASCGSKCRAGGDCYVGDVEKNFNDYGYCNDRCIYESDGNLKPKGFKCNC